MVHTGEINDLIALFGRRNFKRILVMGPPRSGTTLTARVLAELTFTRLYGECWIYERCRADKERGVVLDVLNSTPARYVIHCNGAIFFLRDLDRFEDLLIVRVTRPEAECLASVERIETMVGGDPDFGRCLQSRYELEISEHRGNYVQRWNARWEVDKLISQREIFEIDYKSLADSKYWVPTAGRKGFGVKRTQ